MKQYIIEDELGSGSELVFTLENNVVDIDMVDGNVVECIWSITLEQFKSIYNVLVRCKKEDANV